ncbi:PBSX family phage terminase large subunit [Microvirga sp. KLBC 81]|uniref:PBSX family phage terminase large subunit n=1 Tax=Microvirga sp. KLBC 81 TaxID=1862707 RepID=UPI0014022590|nr:PBSX family phage terminase large subunit [Microvirga sp. KLBC 81]
MTAFEDIEIAESMLPLLGEARYKAAYGGRAGMKSHFFADQVVLRGRKQRLRVACIREIQNSLKESVRQLIIDKIERRSQPGEWTITDSEMRHNRTGTLIIFKGMQSFNADNIKSLEGFDIIWVEEAQTLSARSLRILRPTVRKEGSQLWFSWNPRHDTDAVDRFFRGQEPPPGTILVETNWRDNPWLSPEIRAEIEHDFRVDPEMAHHVWDGGYEIITEGSYYARLIAQAEREGRIGDFPYDPAYRLRTAWDIGVDDYTAVWFIQDNGIYRWVVDYWETSGDGPQQVVEAALPELLADPALTRANLVSLGRETAFKYERHFLPHDVMVREWGAGAKERWKTLKELGVWPLHPGVQQPPEERINATRKLLPLTRFNNTRRVQTGLSRLRRYTRKFHEQMGVWQGPQHDINSHGADAFGEYAVNCGIIPMVERVKAQPKAQNLTYEARQMPDGTVRVVSNMSIMDIVNARLKGKRRR